MKDEDIKTIEHYFSDLTSHHRWSEETDKYVREKIEDEMKEGEAIAFSKIIIAILEDKNLSAVEKSLYLISVAEVHLFQILTENLASFMKFGAPFLHESQEEGKDELYH